MTPTQPLLRLAASPFDSHMLATFASDSNLIRILDVRQPGTALLELRGHQGNLNSIEWSPHKRGLLASGGDDSLVMTWDLINSENQAVLPSINGNGANAGDIPSKGPSSSWRESPCRCRPCCRSREGPCSQGYQAPRFLQ